MHEKVITTSANEKAIPSVDPGGGESMIIDPHPLRMNVLHFRLHIYCVIYQGFLKKIYEFVIHTKFTK